MQQCCSYGSVRGAAGNRRPYRDTRAVRWPVARRGPKMHHSRQPMPPADGLSVPV